MSKRAIKTETIKVRFTEEEAKHIRKVAEESGGNVSEFVRYVINKALAEEGNVEANRMLAVMWEKGVHKLVEKRVQAEIAKAKREYERSKK